MTVFDSVGFALEDYSALGFMLDAAADLGLGEMLDLLPRTADPKNLFGVLRPPAAPRAVAPRRRDHVLV